MNKPETTDLRDHIGYRLRVASNAVSQSFARKLAERDVTVAEWVILREMYSSHERISPSDVASLTGLTRGAVSKLVDRLLNKQLVVRATSLEDRRYQDIGLTDQAIALVPDLAKIADENDAWFFSILSAEERSAFMSTLIKLAKYHQLNQNPIE